MCHSLIVLDHTVSNQVATIFECENKSNVETVKDVYKLDYNGRWAVGNQ